MAATKKRHTKRAPDPNAAVFSTGQVASLCKVAPRTVAKWVNSGWLKGYRIPGGQDRRVPRESLIRFLKENGMPLGELDGPRPPLNVLLVGLGREAAGEVAELLPAADGFRKEAVESVFDAGLLVHEFRPGAVVVDGYVGREELLRIARAIRANGNGSAGALLVAVVGEDFGSEAALAEAGYDRFLVRPIDPAALAGLIRAGREE